MVGQCIKKKYIAAIVFINTLLLLGCQAHTSCEVKFIPICKFEVNEKQPSSKHPAEFYLCSGYRSSCKAVTKKWSGVTRRKANLKNVNSKERGNENFTSRKKCLVK